MKRQLKKFTLVVFGMLLFQSSFSQINYLPGYVINNNGETLNGLIDQRNWERNPDKIKFKTNSDTTPVIYKPTDVLEFKVGNEVYVSATVDTEVSNVTTDMLDDDSRLKIKVETVFLQTFFKGEKSLYYYKNADRKMNFYIKKNTVFELLVYKKYLKGIELREYKKYLGQLSLYLNDCSSIMKKLEKVSYKKGSLIDLFKSYYKCSGDDVSFQKKRKKSQIEIGVLTGVSFTNLDFNSKDSFRDLVNTQYNVSTNIPVGLFVDLTFEGNFSKWSFNSELLFSSYKFKGDYEKITNENDYSTTKTVFRLSYLKINNLLRYRYPVGRTFLFFNGGISNGLALKKTNTKEITTKFYSTDRIYNESAIKAVRTQIQGYILGSGIKYKNVSFEIRFEKTNGVSGAGELDSSLSGYSFLCGYRF